MMNNNMRMNNMNYNMNNNINNNMMMNNIVLPQACNLGRVQESKILASAYSNCMQPDFIRLEKSAAFSNAVERGQREMGAEFEKPGKAKEYKERHYYLKDHNSQKIDNPFWLDFAEYILEKKTNEGFLSKYVLYNNENLNFKEFLMIISIIDIPVESKKHSYKKIPESRLVSITPDSNLILFTKELIETKLELNSKLLISQNLTDTYHNENNANSNNCATNIEYMHQTIVTNISNKGVEFELFIQIPQGAIGMKSTYYTNMTKITLNPYETKNHVINFYFPKDGKFTQYHPLACKNSKIISIGAPMEYIVKKEYTPSKKIETTLDINKYSKDLHIDGKLRNILSDDSIELEKKKQNILDYFTNDVINSEDIVNVLYLLIQDKSFYTKFIEILRKRGHYDYKVWSIGFH